MISDERLAEIDARIPKIRREDMSYSEQDKADLLHEVRRLNAELKRAVRACKTFSKVVDRQAVDICRIANVEMSEEGDADFGLAWDRVEGMPAEIARLNAMIADALDLDPDGNPRAIHDVTCNTNYQGHCNCWQKKLGGGE